MNKALKAGKAAPKPLADIAPVDGEEDEAPVVALQEVFGGEASRRDMVARDARTREVRLVEGQIDDGDAAFGQMSQKGQFAPVAADGGHDSVAFPVKRMGEPQPVLEHQMPAMLAGEARDAVNAARDRRRNHRQDAMASAGLFQVAAFHDDYSTTLRAVIP